MVVSWQSEEFPAGENDDTLEEKRKQMVLLHSTEGMSGANRGELHKLMAVTYYRQRHDINATPPLIKREILWSLKLLLAHFKERTESLLIEADITATAADMEREGLPDSPALIIQVLLLYFVSLFRHKYAEK
ncbi:uncharacterized protein LOC122146071 [Tachysurus ichikawai]